MDLYYIILCIPFPSSSYGQGFRISRWLVRVFIRDMVAHGSAAQARESDPVGQSPCSVTSQLQNLGQLTHPSKPISSSIKRGIYYLSNHEKCLA